PFEGGKVGALSSVVPGSGPNGITNDPMLYGDNPNNKGVIQASGPRDPDKFDADDDTQREFRQRFIPSGLANEIFLDVYHRLASFEPGVGDFNHRLFDAYAAAVASVDTNNDGAVSAAEGDADTASDGFADHARLFIPATEFQAAGLYDPAAPDAPARLDLLEWLAAQGATLADMREAQLRWGALTGLAGDLALRAGERLTLAEVAARSGMSPERIERFNLAAAFPPVGPEERVFDPGTVAMFASFAAAEQFVGQ